MNAISFVAKVKDGTIQIPEQYLSALSDEITVFIIFEPKTKPKRKRSFTTLSAAKIKTKGFKFNRDEANSR